MAGMKYLFMLLCICVSISINNCNVIPRENSISELVLSQDLDVEEKSWFDDVTVMDLKNLIDFDDFEEARLKSTKSSSIGIIHQHGQITSVHHFARHGLCRNMTGKVRLYTALKSRMCNTKNEFIAHIVDDLCAEKGRRLDKWVTELFDFDEDGNIAHFEKIFYDDFKTRCNMCDVSIN